MFKRRLNPVIFLDKRKFKVQEEKNKTIYLSKEIKIKDFKKIIISWNIVTPVDSYVDIEARVLVNNNLKEKIWSKWLSWGRWGTNIKRASNSSNCTEAKINVDTLTINEGYIGEAIQIKISSYYDDKESKADLQLVVITYCGEKINNKNGKEKLINKLIETPCISQMKREAEIANRICSPTSMTMLLNRLGENLLVEDVAYKCFDYKYNEFGNWSYNVAYAGSLGYKAYIQFGNIDLLINELNKGYPVEVSVKYTNDINNKLYPYIENAPLTTSGHLIVVCGMECTKNSKYVIVNDPAAKENNGVRLKYKFDDFMKAWATSNYIMYVIHYKY